MCKEMCEDMLRFKRMYEGVYADMRVMRVCESVGCESIGCV